LNTCRTCITFTDNGGTCEEIDVFPNATIGEYGTYGWFTTDRVHKIMAEIYARGPVAAGVNAEPLVKYQGGIVKDEALWNMMVNHVVSIVGWGTEEETGDKYWIVRNSWVSIMCVALIVVGRYQYSRASRLIGRVLG
jgi:cathepsin X